jgi:hypothetical protein
MEDGKGRGMIVMGMANLLFRMIPLFAPPEADPDCIVITRKD